MKTTKLTTRYNKLLAPVIVFLFIISITIGYFLIKATLQNEVDEVLLRSRSRIENYVKQNNLLPAVSIFNDQKLSFEKESFPAKDTGLSSATQFIPEQNKNHVSRRLVFNLSLNNALYRTVISQPLEGTHHLAVLIAKIALITISLMLLILLFVNRFVLRKMWQPFYQSLAVMKAFSVNDKNNPEFPSTTIEEFQLMNDHFKIVSDNARKEYKSLKEFSENASHEIQTPLAIIRSNLDMLLQQEPLSEGQIESIQMANSAVGKLSKMQKELLLLTKIENQQFQQTKEIDVETEIRNKISEFAELWNAKQINASSELHSSKIIVNDNLFEILLNNLFSNATRHNIKNGSIHIFVNNNQLQISNSGINGALKPDMVFKRFYKASPNSDHNGLGLSIVKEICNASGIEISYHFQKNQHQLFLEW